MSVKLNNSSIKQNVVLEYDSEWEISQVTGSTLNSIKSPMFFPIVGLDLAFCFELWYLLFTPPDSCQDLMSLVRLHLVKLIGIGVSPTLKMKVKVKVCNADGGDFKDFESTNMFADEMSIYDFSNFVTKSKTRSNRNSYDSEHYKKLMETKKLIIKCNISFSDENSLIKCFPESGDTFTEQELFKNLSAIHDSNIATDVIIKIGEKSFLVHKTILIAYSPVFRKMFSTGFDESISNCIVINDSSYESFSMFLKYLYSGEIVDKSWPAVKELYIIADKYDVNLLRERSLSTIKSCLSVDTVCDILLFAHIYANENLKLISNVFAATVIQDLVLTEDWRKLVRDYPHISNDVLMAVINIARNNKPTLQRIDKAKTNLALYSALFVY